MLLPYTNFSFFRNNFSCFCYLSLLTSFLPTCKTITQTDSVILVRGISKFYLSFLLQSFRAECLKVSFRKGQMTQNPGHDPINKSWSKNLGYAHSKHSDWLRQNLQQIRELLTGISFCNFCKLYESY